MTGAITLAAAAVASVGVGAYEASTQKGIANQEESQAGTVFGEQQYYQSQLQQLIANPGSVTSLPGYQFNLSQGEQAVARQFGASAGGGTEGTALTGYAENYANNAYSTQVGVLSSLAGLSSSTNPTSSLAAASSATNAGNNSLQGLLGSLAFGAKSGIFGGGSTPGSSNNSSLDSSLYSGGNVNTGGALDFISG